MNHTDSCPQRVYHQAIWNEFFVISLKVEIVIEVTVCEEKCKLDS